MREVYHTEIKWELLLSKEDREALEKEMAEFPALEEVDEEELIRQFTARAAAAAAAAPAAQIEAAPPTEEETKDTTAEVESTA